MFTEYRDFSNIMNLSIHFKFVLKHTAGVLKCHTILFSHTQEMCMANLDYCTQTHN